MGNFKLNENTIKSLQKAGHDKAKELASEVSKKMVDKYTSLIDWFYLDYTPNSFIYYYDRTFNLYNSFIPYKKERSNRYYGGIKIAPNNKMHDYISRNEKTFKAEDLLEKFIFNTEGTWHGGDWHGGYGKQNSFNIYYMMHKYRDELIKEYKNKYSFK